MPKNYKAVTITSSTTLGNDPAMGGANVGLRAVRNYVINNLPSGWFVAVVYPQDMNNYVNGQLRTLVIAKNYDGSYPYTFERYRNDGTVETKTVTATGVSEESDWRVILPADTPYVAECIVAE